MRTIPGQGELDLGEEGGVFLALGELYLGKGRGGLVEAPSELDLGQGRGWCWLGGGARPSGVAPGASGGRGGGGGDWVGGRGVVMRPWFLPRGWQTSSVSSS